MKSVGAGNLGNALPAAVCATLKQFGPDVFLAGGALRDIVYPWNRDGDVENPMSPKDYDLFMRHSANQAQVIDWLREQPGVKQVKETDRSIIFETANGITIHLVTGSEGGIEDTVDNFDFTFVQASLSFSGGRWSFGASLKFHKDAPTRRVRWTGNGRYPAASLRRLVTFAARGYTVTDQVVCDVATAVHEAGLDDIEIEAQILGSGESRR